MKIPKEWNVLPLPKGKKFPPLLKRWEVTRYPQSKIKVHKGNYALGTGEISGGLIIFDWDFRSGVKETGFKLVYGKYKKEFPTLSNTLIAETPHGFHFYYSIQGEEYTNKSFDNIGYSKNIKSFTASNSTKFSNYLKGMDIRANGGYVVMPPSQINNKRYKWYNENTPLRITKQQYEDIVDFFLVPEEELSKHTVRSKFVDILTGELDVHKIKSQKTPEHVYWKELYHEVYTCSGLEPYRLFKGLKKHQPSFNEDKTNRQLKNKKNWEYITNRKRLTTEKYQEYFDVHKVNEVEDLPLSNGIILRFQSGTYYNNPKYIELREDGIYRVIEKVNSKTNEIEVIEDPLWVWDQFEVSRILIDESNNEYTERFNFMYNQHLYTEYTLYEMRQKMALKSCLNSKDKQIFGNIVHRYVKQKDLPVIEYRRVCGFDEDGWIFPPEYYVSFNKGIQQKIKNNLEEMNMLPVIENVPKKMKKLYATMAVEKKDIILAYGMIAPFLYTLQKYTDLVPFLALQSVRSGTGKSSSAQLISREFWNNFEEVINSDNTNSPSRARDYFSSSTLPIPIDESEKLDDKIIDMIKSMATTSGSAKYKNVDQTLGMDKPLCTPLIYTFNVPPKFFNDTAYLSRGLVLEISKKLTMKEKEAYKKALSLFRRGEIGKYFKEHTKDLTYETLLHKFKEQPMVEHLDTRQETIFKLLYLGKELFLEIFGIELDLSELDVELRKSSHFGSDDIFTIVDIQLEEAVAKKKYVNHTKVPIFEFNPRYNWIRSEVKRHYLKDGTEGYIYNADNLQDLTNRLKLDISGVPELGEILRKRWNVKQYKTYCVDGKSQRGIFIPYNKEILTEEEVLEQYGAPPKEEGVLEYINDFRGSKELKDIMKEIENMYVGNEMIKLDPQSTKEVLEVKGFEGKFVDIAINQLNKIFTGGE